MNHQKLSCSVRSHLSHAAFHVPRQDLVWSPVAKIFQVGVTSPWHALAYPIDTVAIVQWSWLDIVLRLNYIHWLDVRIACSRFLAESIMNGNGNYISLTIAHISRFLGGFDARSKVPPRPHNDCHKYWQDMILMCYPSWSRDTASTST